MAAADGLDRRPVLVGAVIGPALPGVVPQLGEMIGDSDPLGHEVAVRLEEDHDRVRA